MVRTSINALSESRRRWLSLTVIVVAQFMVVLDIAIVNVALPSIKTDLHFPEASLQWVISAYAIVFGGFLLLGGRLADVLGRRRLFVTGPRPLHGELPPLRSRLVRGLADRVPRSAGARRRPARPRGALDPDDDVPGGPRAEPRARHLGRRFRHRRRGGRAARRRAHLVSLLGVGVLHQRPRRRRP